MDDTAKHCDHCSWSCKNDKLLQAYDHSSSDWKYGGEWDDGHCPACAERKRIAQWMRVKAADYRSDELPLSPIAAIVLDAFTNSIERGEHMEDK